MRVVAVGIDVLSSAEVLLLSIGPARGRDIEAENFGINIFRKASSNQQYYGETPKLCATK